MNTPSIPLLNNSRFYILTSSVLLSAVVFAWLRIQITADQLLYIRAEQLFGLMSVVYWYIALVISPLGYVIGKQRIRRLVYALRAIGVSACYFALLHAAVATWGQLGGLDQLHTLPELFKWSLLGGAVGLVVLLVMAATSFDKAVEILTYKWWKWLHRFVYIGGILVVLHIWSVGTHLAYTPVQIAAFIALVVLAGLELFRTTKLLNAKYLHLDKTEVASLFITSWMIVGVLLFMIPIFVENYHGRHAEHNSAEHDEERR